MVTLARALSLLMLLAPCSNAFVMPTTQSSTRMSSLCVATSPEETTTTTKKNFCDVPPFVNIMAANRAEIAVRIMRAATELNAGTVAIYGHEDRYSQHRWGTDRSYLLKKKEGASPISAYLDIEQIIAIAKQANVDAVHPGYGFLSESPQFAQACEDAGITFVGAYCRESEYV